MSIAYRLFRGGLLRRVLSVVLTLVAFGLAIVSAYFLRPGIEGKFQAQAALSLLLGVVTFGGALWLVQGGRKLPTLSPSSDTPLTPATTRWWMVGLGGLLLAIVAEISGQAFLTPALSNVSVHLQFGLLVVGILLVGWGLAGEIRLPHSITDRKTALLLIGVFLIGLAVRVWGLDSTARFMQDETVFTDALSHFWHASNPGLLNGGGAFTITFIYPYWNALTVDVFGRNLIGLRMASVLLGVWVIPVAYELTRTLFDKQAGLIAALLVATFPPVIHFSQISWGHMGDALFGLLTLMFAARAIKWNRRVDWAFAGVSLGLTQYFFETGRLLYPPLLVGWFLLLGLGWRMKAYRRGLVIGFIAAVLIVAPVYYTIAVRDTALMPRMNNSARGPDYWNNLFKDGLNNGERAELFWRATTPFLVYVQHPDSRAEYYGGYEGFVSPPLVPLFFLGIFWLLWRIRAPAGVLLIGLVLVSSANFFANDPGFASRYVAFASIIPIVMAVGLYALLNLLALNRRWLVAGLVTVIALWQIYFYFGVHLPYYNIQRRSLRAERDIFDAVLRTTDLHANTVVFLIDPSPSIDYARARGLYIFLEDHPTQIQAPTQADFNPNLLPRDRDYAFFIAPGDEASINKIRYAFPGISAPIYSTYPIPAWDEMVLLLWHQTDTHIP